MEPVILLFAKAPVPGRVKTRLLPVLPPEAAAELHAAFVADAWVFLQSVNEADVELHTDISTDAFAGLGVAPNLQAPGDLGVKMLAAASVALAEGRPQVLIVGSDAPTLPAAHLRWLLQSQSDVALGPTEDGGFYGIACRRIDAGMFDRVSWSSSSTLLETVSACGRAGLSVEIGPAWFDVDTPEDLRRLTLDPNLPAHTRTVLRRLNASPVNRTRVSRIHYI